MGLLLAILFPISAILNGDGAELACRFEQMVDRRLELPAGEQEYYAGLLANRVQGSPQFVVLVDRNVNVQAVMVFWRPEDGRFVWIGASPVTTGKPGRFEYFETPLGVFAHTLENPDYRAEGTKNEFGIRGYGRKGMRVYDLGWVRNNKGWGDGKESVMRLQMHATDPDVLEPKLGKTGSKGCVRIPASLNVFLDRFGILDEDYVRAARAGNRPYVLSPDWMPVEWPGRYVVIVDSGRSSRPGWAAEKTRR